MKQRTDGKRGGNRRYDNAPTDQSTTPAKGRNKNTASNARSSYGSDRRKTDSPPRDFKPARSGPPTYPKDAARTGYPRPSSDAPRYDARESVESTAHAALDNDDLPLYIYGRNPVKEAIKSGRSIDKLFMVDAGSEDGSLREILRMARERSLVISLVSRGKLDAMTAPFGYGGKPAPHQGVIAQMPAAEYVELDDILQNARDKGEPPFVLILDSIHDPHNLGAIIRSAECAGVHGVVIPKRRSASITATAAKASAGAVMHVPIARVPNLSQCVEALKQAGVWIAGADMDGQPMYEAPLKGALALIVGGEGEGISPLIKKNCDYLVSIPLFGQLNSLNASNAAAVLVYEKLRQDRM